METTKSEFFEVFIYGIDDSFRFIEPQIPTPVRLQVKRGLHQNKNGIRLISFCLFNIFLFMLRTNRDPRDGLHQWI